MITERETSQIAGRFPAKRLNGAIHLVFAVAVALTTLGIGLLRAGVQSETLANSSQPIADPAWSELIASMDKMHVAMEAIKRSGNADVDFVKLMIPHHQGAIDMAKTFLLHGQDAPLRRLAQEIIVTQQQEIQVMQLRLATLATGGGSAPTEKKQHAAAPLPVSEKDRVYTGDQTSNTVSVINPASNKLLGVIRLGDPVPGALSPLYRGQLLVHGIGFSPDHRTIAVVSIGSNSVTLIDTTTNKIKGVIYIGRSPHEAILAGNAGRERRCRACPENAAFIASRSRKDHRGVDLISNVLSFGRLMYDGPNAVSNAIGYAQHYSRSRDAIIRVYRTCLLRISCQSHILSRPARGVGVCLARYYIQLYLRRLGVGSIGINPHNDGVLTCRQVAAVISALGKASLRP